ncbi:acetylserotonin O-methyltransferase-like isoform X2 [Dendrobates tinctorius]|uniref:acetylserotonin O-methyltransferase-like isoform X2 n=1 Tax=Dendrobates tinctorius TaxID=92724 RepID=UPI003CC9364B
MCSSEELEYPQKLFDYAYGFLVSKTMFTACELGVFDFLHEAQEPVSAATIASRLSTSVGGMERLLDACVGLKLLKVDLKNSEGYYSNTDVSTVYLVKSSPRSLFHMMSYYSQTTYMCWHFLPQAVREGKCQYERPFGVSSKELFEAIFRSEEEMVTFMHNMDTMWNVCGKDIVQAFDLSAFHTVFDLGGCSGALAKQFVSRYNESTVTIMDLPKVVETAKKRFITDKDQQIHFLEGGGVLLVEVLLNEDRSGPVTSQLHSLNMLVQTEGRERTPSEYTKLLTDSGFRDVEVKATGKIHDVILGRKLINLD